MKTYITILLAILFCSVSAQEIVLQVGAEKTVAGAQYGTMISAESKKQWGIGIFYQNGIANSSENNRSNSSSFFGTMVQAPLVRCEKITVFANLRAGLVNEKFVVISPSVETRMSLSPRTGIAFGSSIRMGHPSLYARAFLKIF